METRYYYRPWQESSLISALHFLRCRIVREKQDGLEHVDALLLQLGVEPDDLPMPRKTDRYYKRGELQRGILDALRKGPLTGSEIADRIKGELDPKKAYKRTYITLSRLKKAGILKHEDGLWKLKEGGSLAALPCS